MSHATPGASWHSRETLPILGGQGFERDLGPPIKVRVRSDGLSREQWMVRDGFAVTTPARTIADLAADRMDGGHLGRIALDAMAGVVTEDEIRAALAGRADLAAILTQATDTVR